MSKKVKHTIAKSLMKYDDEKMTPAFPPDDYKGSQAEWMTELQIRGLWNGEGFHGDVMIPTEIWWEILEKCEGEEDE